MNIEGQYATVKGSKMHYLQLGDGDPIVFIHGMPTCAYLWRHIMPELADQGRCIAIDLMGMGESDKPDIDYRVFDHIHYFDAFVDSLGLKNITLVMHGWGSLVGFDYARRHPDNVKGLAFYESHIRPMTDWNMLSLPVQQLATLLERPKASRRAIVDQNYFIEKLLPSGVVQALSQADMAQYQKPFPTPESRKPLWQYAQELPLGEEDSDVTALINEYSIWLQETPIPKLMLYAVPGFITTIDTVQWAKTHCKNLTLVGLDDALHFAQESAPEEFARALKNWHTELVS